MLCYVLTKLQVHTQASVLEAGLYGSAVVIGTRFLVDHRRPVNQQLISRRSEHGATLYIS